MVSITRRLIVAAVGAVIVAYAGVAAAQQAPQSVYDIVKARGALIAGLRNDFPPAGFVDEQGQWVGIDIDLAQYVADQLGVKLQREQVTSRTRIPMLVNGNVDVVVASMGPTRERAKVVDFTIPYFIGGTRILTKKDSGIGSLADLGGRKVGMAQGSSEPSRLLAFQPKAEIVYFQEWPMALLALKQGRVEALSTTDTTLAALSKGDPSLAVVGPVFLPDPWVMGTRLNDSKWREFLDEMIMQAWTDGTIEKLYAKYIGGKPPFTIPVWPEYLFK